MKCPDRNTWNLLSMNLLDETEAVSLRNHCAECERCRVLWQEALGQHSELLAAFKAFDGDHDQHREQLMAMLDRPVSGPDAARRPAWLGGIAMSMRRHKARWAAVALLPAACILLAFVLLTGEKIAFADVLQKMRAAKTMVCDVVTTTTVVEGELPDPALKEPSRGAISMYFDGDTRAMLFEDKRCGVKTRSLQLGDTVYVWAGDTVRALQMSGENRPASLEKWTAGTPGDLLSRLLDVRDSPDRSLGEETIAGHRAVGFEIAGWRMGYGVNPTNGKAATADSESRLRVWVDVERDLPIRFETETKMVWPDATAVICSRWDNIKWDVPVNVDDFRPPAEEEIAKTETVQIPTADEANFIDEMRSWVELKEKALAGIEMIKKKAKEKGEDLPAPMSTMIERATLDAGYPERLDMSWLMGTFSARATLAMFADMFSEMKPIPENLAKEERAELVQSRARESAMAAAEVAMKSGLKATAIAAFYRTLANEQREPEYFGATVKPGDKKAVLMRWKLDDGRYRVIYGDLQVGTAD